jgi:hypothetical protein
MLLEKVGLGDEDGDGDGDVMDADGVWLFFTEKLVFS